jgi:ParB/RepB/Spo0J family partition protein
MAPVRARKAPAKGPKVQMLPIDSLVPTPDNTRRPITNASVESLARSMVRDGVLQPIVVRTHPTQEGKYEIRAGERRWRAAKLAKLEFVPAIVRPLDDAAAQAVTIAENLQRENLHPLEEAAAFRQALDRGQDTKTLAARLGKPVAFVLRRASLTALTESWQAEIRRPESDAGRFSVAHLELISRLPAETQDLLAADGFTRIFGRGFPTAAELRRIIDEGLCTLVSMPWKLDDETIDPKAGSCLNCPKRSSMHPALFDEEDAPRNGKVSDNDRCLDPSCFDRKTTAFVLQRETELRAKHPDLRLVQIGYDRLSDATREALGGRVTRLYNVRVVRASKPGAVPVMQVDGPKAGSLVYVDGGDEATPNGRAWKSEETANDQHKPLTMPERRERLQRRRDAFLVRKVESHLREFDVAKARDAARRLLAESVTDGARFDALSLVLTFGTSTRADRESGTDSWTLYEQHAATSLEDKVTKAIEELVPVWTRRIAGVDGHSATPKASDARRVCALLGIDAVAIDAEAVQELPDPKAWAAMTEPEPPPFDQDEPAPNDRGGTRRNQRVSASTSRTRRKKGGVSKTRRAAKRR